MSIKWEGVRNTYCGYPEAKSDGPVCRYRLKNFRPESAGLQVPVKGDTLRLTEREYVKPERIGDILKLSPLDQTHHNQAKSQPPHIWSPMY